MSSVLIVYASTHGHTGKVAEHLADAVRGQGLDVDVREVGDTERVELSSYDWLVVGASVHGGRHQRGMTDRVKHHHLAFEARPSAFFPVSLTAAEDPDEASEATQRYIDDFFDESGWTPTRYAPVAGALQYREYDVFTRAPSYDS